MRDRWEYVNFGAQKPLNLFTFPNPIQCFAVGRDFEDLMTFNALSGSLWKFMNIAKKSEWS